MLGEDDFLAREGITAVLDQLDEIELVGSSSDLDTLRAEIDDHDPDVVVTDIRMPPDHGDEGIQLARQLRSTHPRIGVVVLTQVVEPLYAMALFADGAYRRAYLLKERLREPEELARAIREVATGGAVVDPRVVDELLSARHRQETSPLAALTPREIEILELVAAGHTNSAIADRLAIGRRGVERHINAIFAKLDLGHSEDVSRRVKAALLYLGSQERPPGSRLS